VAKEEGEAAGEAAGGAPAAAAAPPPKRSSKKLLLFVILPLVLLLAGGLGYYFFFAKKKEATPAEQPPPPAKTYVYYKMPEFVVNLPASTAGRVSFLKLTISLELDSAADVRPVQVVMPRVVDRVQAYLRELRPDDVRGTAALARLRQELLDRVTQAAPNANVHDVLLEELLLQ